MKNNDQTTVQRGLSKLLAFYIQNQKNGFSKFTLLTQKSVKIWKKTDDSCRSIKCLSRANDVFFLIKSAKIKENFLS